MVFSDFTSKGKILVVFFNNTIPSSATALAASECSLVTKLPHGRFDAIAVRKINRKTRRALSFKVLIEAVPLRKASL